MKKILVMTEFGKSPHQIKTGVRTVPVQLFTGVLELVAGFEGLRSLFPPHSFFHPLLRSFSATRIILPLPRVCLHFLLSQVFFQIPNKNCIISISKKEGKEANLWIQIRSILAPRRTALWFRAKLSVEMDNVPDLPTILTTSIDTSLAL